MTELRAEFTALKTTAGGIDPVRLRYIESLLCKAERAGGDLAPVLERKVRDAIAAYRQAEERTAPTPRQPRRDPGLADLVQQLNEYRSDDDDPHLAPLEHALRQQELDLAVEFETGAQGACAPVPSPQQELRAARRFQSAMVRHNADRVVTRALAAIPADCGPLNPQRLATRSLQTMRDLSPPYLSRFVSYIDTLFWLEDASEEK